MGEIKFRAFDDNTRDGGMIYSDDFTEEYEDDHLIEFFRKTRGMKKQQFTGLKDKKGKEIYEGDIVNYTHKVETTKAYEFKLVTDILEVKWNNDYAKFSISGLSPFNRKDMFMKAFEVIGNKFENPELIKEVK